jgi:tetratricopeptide (TPR) repeat protein
MTAQDDPEPEPEPDEDRIPLFKEMQLPTPEQLLTGEPVDWVVLRQKENFNENEVLVVQPVFPRPDTLAKLAKNKAQLSSVSGRPQRDAGETEGEFRQRVARLIEEANNLIIMLPDAVTGTDVDQTAEYTLATGQVAKVIHHEDLFLQRCDKLIEDGELEQSFEMLIVLQRRNPDWPGYDDVRNRLIMAEGAARLDKDDLETALAFFEELHGLAPDFAELQKTMGEVVDQLVTESAQAGDLRRARYYVGRLKDLEPDHATVEKWVKDFTTKANVLLNDALAARQAGRHDEAVRLAEEAAAIWPLHPNLRSVYGDASERFQVLNVGVFRFPGEPTPYFLPTTADQRHAALQTLNLFELSRYQRAAFYESRYFEEWTPTDLGRRLVFRLKSRRSSWEPNTALTAPQVVRSIGDRLRPESPYYDERLASFVRSMEVRSPYEFTLNFSTVPVRPQAIFRFPIRSTDDSGPGPGPLSASVDDGATETAADSDVLSSRFRVHDRDTSRIVFRRVVPQPDRTGKYSVAEIVEYRYDDYEAAIQAVLRGDISVLPAMPIFLAAMFEPDERFHTVPYAVPTTHVLQFNPNSEPLKVGEFRRSISYMLDRERILKTTVLKDQAMERGRIVSAPFPSNSYAYQRQVEPRPKDLTLAFSLKTIAAKRMGGEVPELTMICEPNAVVRAAALKIIEQWNRFGIKVTLVPDDQPTPENWDILYRTVRMTEPVADLWPFLTMKPSARVDDLEHLPDWLRQQLIELEQAVDFRSAVQQLRELHFRLNELVYLIPLWEVDDVIVIRRNIQGFPQQIVSPYQNVERWFVGPWFPKGLL